VRWRESKTHHGSIQASKRPFHFLEGGAGDAADRTAKYNRLPSPFSTGNRSTRGRSHMHREQKVFRLPLSDLINELKREAYERSTGTRLRVTETELVEIVVAHFQKARFYR
jgi:hypothetical protein